MEGALMMSGKERDVSTRTISEVSLSKTPSGGKRDDFEGGEAGIGE